MKELANHLARVDPANAGLSLAEGLWEDLVTAISQDGIEAALHQKQVDEPLADFIRAETARCIRGPETQVIKEVLNGSRRLKFSRLLPHLSASGRLPIITTNYDRLVELAAEMSGYQVDTKTRGFYYAPFSATNSQFAFCSNIIPTKGRGYRKVEGNCISLYKPHGSLDWTLVNGQPVRTAFDVEPGKALIITPGQNKYRAGYDTPFYMQRELANKIINEAVKFLIIGYGFNDNHLEVHLRAKISAGTPTVLMTHGLTDNAKAYIKLSSSIYALEHDPAAKPGTLIHFGGNVINLQGEDIWDVEGFVKGVMGDG